MFENRVLRVTSGAKGDEVTWEWRKLHNEELTDLYRLANNFRVINTSRDKSDVWLTVHRNSVWIRKTN